MKEIYLDNASTTKIDNLVLEEMKPYLEESYANPSSKHEFGKKVKEKIESSRKIIAESINSKPNEIIFTSGGTESNNLAIKRLVNKGKKKIIISLSYAKDKVY